MNTSAATPPVTRDLARFFALSSPGDIPAGVMHEAKRAVLNALGCALGACRDEVVERALATMQPFSASTAATVCGRAERTDALAAAWINTMAANVLDFDDTHLPTVIHPSAVVAFPLLALAEHRPIAGVDLLHAFVLGVEAECRIGNAVSPGHYAHGFHITSTCGVFGAAAAAGRVLGLGERAMAWALGIAATRSSGLVESLPTMAKSINAGDAARNGLGAALLAAQGFSGAETGLEGPRGFLRVMAQDADDASITAGLGATWELQKNGYKPYPCGVVLAPVIDACLELRERHGITAASIERIRIAGHPLLRERADRALPRAGREGKLSVQHCAAIAFLAGRATLAEFTDAAVADPGVAALRARVELVDDPALAVEASVATVTLHDGGVHEVHVPHARGSVARPLSDAELEAKFRAQAAVGAPAVDAGRVIDAVWGLDRAPDAAALARLTGTAAVRG